jgi:diguanylate cyclase (GGDEF)-like protein
MGMEPPGGTSSRGPWRLRRGAFLFLPLLLLLAAVRSPAAEDPAVLEQRLARSSGGERVELLLSLAEANLYRSPDKVVSYAQQALDAAVASHLTREAARALLLRGSGQFQQGDLDAATASYQQGLAANRDGGEHDIIGGCLNGLAAVHLKRGQLDDALAYLTQAIEQLEQGRRKDKLAGAYSNLSLIYYNKGRYDRSLDYMSKALRLYEEIGDLGGQGVVLNSIGNVYNKLDDPRNARENFERALAIAEKTNHKQLIVSSLVNLGEIDSGQKAWDSALGNLNRALAIARELGSRDFISVCLNNIGDVLRDRGQSQEALRFYLESQKIFEAMNARPRLAVSYLNIGRLFLKTGRPDEGEAFLLKAFDLARDADERSLQKDAAGELFALYEGRGDFRRALAYQRTFDGLKEQIFSKDNVEKISTLQARYESEKQAREIELLQRQREIQQLQAKRQRLLTILVASVSLLLAVVAGVLYQRYRVKARTNAELGAAYARMADLAKTDELTGLLNRRSALERIEIELVRASRTGRPFGVVMVDVDDFKRINDEHGHDCGDAVLAALAALLRENVRALDVVARWGGEEFLMVLPETSRQGAALVAEKLRAAVAATPVSHGGAIVRYTVTVGVDAFERLGSVSECIRAADGALYEGKRTGKNRVVTAA